MLIWYYHGSIKCWFDTTRVLVNQHFILPWLASCSICWFYVMKSVHRLISSISIFGLSISIFRICSMAFTSNAKMTKGSITCDQHDCQKKFGQLLSSYECSEMISKHHAQFILRITFKWFVIVWEIALNWIDLIWIELNWIQLNWFELIWIELIWFELIWIELNWIEFI